MVGDGKEAPLQIQGPILQTHGRKRNAAAWGRLPAHMHPFRPACCTDHPRSSSSPPAALLVPHLLPRAVMISDVTLSALANWLGSLTMILIVLYHVSRRNRTTRSPTLCSVSHSHSPSCEFRHSASTSSATRSLRAESLRPRRHTPHIPRALSSIA